MRQGKFVKGARKRRRRRRIGGDRISMQQPDPFHVMARFNDLTGLALNRIQRIGKILTQCIVDNEF